MYTNQGTNVNAVCSIPIQHHCQLRSSTLDHNVVKLTTVNFHNVVNVVSVDISYSDRMRLTSCACVFLSEILFLRTVIVPVPS